MKPTQTSGPVQKTSLLLFILLLFSISGFAQKLDQESRTSFMVVNPSFKEKVNVTDKSKKVKPNTALNYYWYHRNKVHQSQGDFAGELLHGAYVSFYRENQLKSKGAFKFGLKEGDWLYWRRNGTLEKKEHWKKGRLNGKQIQYTAEGKDSLIVSYRKGVPKNSSLTEGDGSTLKFEVYDHEGNLKETRKIHVTDSGNVSEESEQPKPKKSVFRKWFGKNEKKESEKQKSP